MALAQAGISDYSDTLEELINSLPEPSATATVAAAFQRAGLEPLPARYCASLGASLYLLDSGLLPALNRTLNASVDGTPARSRQYGLMDAAVPHCRKLQGLFAWLLQALGDGGISAGCYSASFDASAPDAQLVLEPVAEVGLLQTGRAVARSLIQLSVDFCNGELPGDWGQPYGSELFFVAKFATATVQGEDSGSASPPANGSSAGYDWWSAASPPPPPPSLYDNGYYGYNNNNNNNNGNGSSGWYYDPYYGWSYGQRRLLSVLEEDAASGRERSLLAPDSYGNGGAGAEAAADDGEGYGIFAHAMRDAVTGGRAVADGAHKPAAVHHSSHGGGTTAGVSGLLRRLMSGLGLGGEATAAASERSAVGAAAAAAVRQAAGCRHRGRRLMQSGADLGVVLTNRSTDVSGRVLRGRPEAGLVPDGDLGSICDDAFSHGSAAVICRQLGYPGGGLAYASAAFGAASRPYILDGLNCTGTESNIGQCPANPLWSHDCRPSEAAGVVCFPAFNETSYCADVTANITRLYPTSPNTTAAGYPPGSSSSGSSTGSSGSSSSSNSSLLLTRCGDLLGLAAAASTLVGYKFPGQYMSYREIASYDCGRGAVAPAMMAWLAAWRREVAAAGCTELIVPYLWMQRLGDSLPPAPPSSGGTAPPRQPPPPLPPAPPSRTNDSCPAAVAVWPTAADRAAAAAAAPTLATPAVPAPTTYMILDYVSDPPSSITDDYYGSSGSNRSSTSALDPTCTPPTAWLAAGGAPNRRTRRSSGGSGGSDRNRTRGGPAAAPPPARAPTPTYYTNSSYGGFDGGGYNNASYNSSYYYYNFTSHMSSAARRLFRRVLLAAATAAASPPPPPPAPLSAAAASFLRYGASSAMWASASSAFASVWSPRDLVNVSSLTRTLARGGPSWLPARLSDRRHLLSTLEAFSRPGGIDLLTSGILDTVRWALATLPSPAPPPSDANRPPRPPSPPPFRWTGTGDGRVAIAANPAPSAPPRPPLRNGGANSSPPPAPPSPPAPPPPGPRAAISALAAAMPLKPSCVAYDSSWSDAEGFRSDFQLLDFLASGAASADGGWDGWGQQVRQSETELLYCNARQELRSRHTVSGIVITGLGLGGGAAATVRTLLRGARAYNSSSSGSDNSDGSNAGAAAIPAANLAFLDLSGNALTGAVPAIPVPVLHVNLSSNDLSGDLRFQLTTNLTAAAFTATLVLDLSDNLFTGQLPSLADAAMPTAAASPSAGGAAAANGTGAAANAWSALLSTAVRIDLSGNDLTGTLPPDWAPLLAAVDLVVSRNPRLSGGVPDQWLAAARGLAPYGGGESGGSASLASLIASAAAAVGSAAGAAAPSPPSPPAPPGAAAAGNGGGGGGDPPRQGALLIDLSGCSGLSGRFNQTADYSTLRVRGTQLKLDWKKLPPAERRWSYVVDRVAREHMDFEQVAYSKTGISNVLTKAWLLDPNEVISVCDAIDGLRNTERRAVSSGGSSSGTATTAGSSGSSSSSSNGGDVVVAVATEPWPHVRSYLQVHDSYTDWQTDPAVWCYGGAKARGIVALKVWLPVLIISALACGLALPGHHLRDRARRRAAARRAAWAQQQQQNQQQESKDGKKGPAVNAIGAPEGRFAKAWRRVKEVMTPVVEVVEPRLILALYWVDLISDIVFIAGYKGWGRQPAPAIAVIIILLANLTAGWVMHLVHLRKQLGGGAAAAEGAAAEGGGGGGWSVRRCVVVGILTAPLGIVLEWAWNGLLTVVTVAATWRALAKGDRKAHVTALQRITRDWPVLLNYEGSIHIFEQTVLLEPLNESLPQAIVQTTCYVVGRNAGMVILTPIFLFSAILQAISIAKSCLVLAWRVFKAGSWADVIMLRDDEGGDKPFSHHGSATSGHGAAAAAVAAAAGKPGKGEAAAADGSGDACSNSSSNGGGEGDGTGAGSDGSGGGLGALAGGRGAKGGGGGGGGKERASRRGTWSSSLSGVSATTTSSGALPSMAPPPPTDAQLATFAGVPAFLLHHQQQQQQQQMQMQGPPPVMFVAGAPPAGMPLTPPPQPLAPLMPPPASAPPLGPAPAVLAPPPPFLAAGAASWGSSGRHDYWPALAAAASAAAAAAAAPADAGMEPKYHEGDSITAPHDVELQCDGSAPPASAPPLALAPTAATVAPPPPPPKRLQPPQPRAVPPVPAVLAPPPPFLAAGAASWAGSGRYEYWPALAAAASATAAAAAPDAGEADPNQQDEAEPITAPPDVELPCGGDAPAAPAAPLQLQPQVLQPPQPAAAFGFSPLTAHLQGWRAPASAPIPTGGGAGVWEALSAVLHGSHSS
ncbi:hypothetical protein HXX76_012952 [Chlamydomonas incerta]|uniref:SRCR domain-containing protein n=1 Tax=Chlamydomonas incerta TaxID=51695 RepID=A0A835SG76_CHLIN|nr:hypothetical protein HXX76_012952 [Chlamydomonas incerta]|eukprot:KAG2426638.1 hypothetical protein HXX76_012952 [Chlamydomonas incerta]